jgi:hypothetical protein
VTTATQRPSLFIATPTHDGMVHIAYHRSLLRLCMTATSFDLQVGAANYDTDIVRARSWLVADFLESSATHLLFIDSDTDFTPEIVEGLVAAGKDYVCAPYRKKRPEVVYPGVFLTDKPTVDAGTKCVQIGAFGLGMTLLSRAMLERMSKAYAEALTISDMRKLTQPGKSVALFDLVHHDGSLLSEDFSFGWRWRQMGGELWLYLGAGVCGHHGNFRYAGDVAHFKGIEAVALERSTPPSPDDPVRKQG